MTKAAKNPDRVKRPSGHGGLSNPVVQNVMATFVHEHPVLSALGVTFSSVGHLLTESKPSPK